MDHRTEVRSVITTFGRVEKGISFYQKQIATAVREIDDLLDDDCEVVGRYALAAAKRDTITAAKNKIRQFQVVLDALVMSDAMSGEQLVTFVYDSGRLVEVRVEDLPTLREKTL